MFMEKPETKKQHQFKPSLERVESVLEGLDHEIIMYIYHKCNGRNEEAQTYLNCFCEEQRQMLRELKPIEDIEE
jgi:ferredoxin-thioredoxin reductase catalytic subunit